MFRPSKIFNKRNTYYPFKIQKIVFKTKKQKISSFFHELTATMTDGMLLRVEGLRYMVYYENTRIKENVHRHLETVHVWKSVFREGKKTPPFSSR